MEGRLLEGPWKIMEGHGRAMEGDGSPRDRTSGIISSRDCLILLASKPVRRLHSSACNAAALPRHHKGNWGVREGWGPMG